MFFTLFYFNCWCGTNWSSLGPHQQKWHVTGNSWKMERWEKLNISLKYYEKSFNKLKFFHTNNNVDDDDDLDLFVNLLWASFCFWWDILIFGMCEDGMEGMRDILDEKLLNFQKLFINKVHQRILIPDWFKKKLHFKSLC